MGAAIREERGGYRGDIVHSRRMRYCESSRKRVAHPGNLVVKSQYEHARSNHRSKRRLQIDSL
jgi:hypothetical protein